MLPFKLDALPSKELFKDVVVRLVDGDELTLNYFELKSESVKISLHKHPVEHLIVVLKGEIEFMFEDRKMSLKNGESMFVPAKKRHTARVVEAPVKALEIYTNVEDKYYKGKVD
jgi:quercetin dioxygenase-like cupin family protein